MSLEVGGRATITVSPCFLCALLLAFALRDAAADAGRRRRDALLDDAAKGEVREAEERRRSLRNDDFVAPSGVRSRLGRCCGEPRVCRLLEPSERLTMRPSFARLAGNAGSRAAVRPPTALRYSYKAW